MKFLKLKGKIAEKGLTQIEIAKKLGLTPQSFNAKLNGRAIFNLEEIKQIVDELDLKDSEIGEIFLI